MKQIHSKIFLQHEQEVRNFIRVWQTSKTATEVSRVYGFSRNYASQRAAWLRSRGVMLKLMSPRTLRPHFNWKGLQKLAEKFAPRRPN